jgi:hypothetical protein
MSRKATPAITVAEVLTKSTRRCALCFYLRGNLGEKKGQIAHLDQDPSNYAEDNLAFLCLEHHSEYDSKTSQHKNFTEKEAKIARARLYEAIVRKEHFPAAARGHLSSWEIRYPGGLVDLSPLPADLGSTTRLAIAENIIVINPSDHAISVRVKLLIQYGFTQLVLEPTVIPTEEWEAILERFGLRKNPSLTFPLTLKADAFEGNIAFPVSAYGAGRGVAGDIPEQRAYTLEFEDVLSGTKKVVPVSALFALDANNHHKAAFTDLACPVSQIIRPADWNYFSLQYTVRYGGQEAYNSFIPENRISFTVEAPCSMRDVINAIAEHSAKPFPIDALAQELDQPVLPRGKTLFDETGKCIDQVVENYPGMQWWFTSKGLIISDKI